MRHPPDFVADTDPKALEVFFELQRRKSLGQKLEEAFELSEWMFELQKAGVRLRYPDASEREVFLRAAALRIPAELMRKVYGWNPEEHD